MNNATIRLDAYARRCLYAACMVLLAALPAIVHAQTITTITGNGVNATTLNGNGGPAASASVGTLRALAYDAAGNLYFSERFAVRKISTAGVLTTIAGGDTSGATGDGGQATAALFGEIRALAIDSVGNIYIAEARKIRRINAATGVITLFAGQNGCVPGGQLSGENTSTIIFCSITGLGFDSANNLYVADGVRGASIIRMARVGTSVTSFALSCISPIDVKVSPDGLIVAICRNNGSDDIRRYNSGGGYVDVLAAPTDLVALAIDAANTIYVSTTSHNVYNVSAGGNAVGNGVAGFSGDGGVASSAQLNSPAAIAIHPANLLTIADAGNFRIRRYLGIVPDAPTIISATGSLNQATVSFTAPAANGGPAITGYTATCGAMSVSGPTSPIVVAPIIVNASVPCSVTATNLVGSSVASATQNAQVFTYLIHTIAGNGTFGFSGDGGQAINALLRNPSGIIFDPAGNLIVSDFSNHRLRKITPAGVITTIAGTGVSGSTGDGGQATSAQLNSPVSAIFDTAGNLYVSEFQGSRIRKITPAGIISTVAGTGVAGSSGDGGLATSAQLFQPLGLAFDSTGNLYIAERQGGRVRKTGRRQWRHCRVCGGREALS